MKNKRCKLCRFWLKTWEDTLPPYITPGPNDPRSAGECHRAPPQFNATGHQSLSRQHGEWPMTHDTDWCGEWEESLE